MSALNKKGTGPKRKTAVSFNGNVQSAKADEQQLYEALVMTMWGKDNYYESNDARLDRVKAALHDIVKRGNFDFVANAIVYARTVMNIRSFPVVIAVEFARELREQKQEYPGLRNVVTDVIQRADQINDLYAYALAVFGEKGKVPMAIRRGVAQAFNKFNEYQFAKYNRSDKVKFRDVLRIVHPVGKTPEQGEIFAKIMKDELSVPNTWEVQLSTNGQKGADKLSDKDMWTKLVKATQVDPKGRNVPTIGYMALLRNVRNILQAGVDNTTLKEYVCTRLQNPEEVQRSKQLPFSFVNAIDALGDNSNTSVRDAIEEALDISLTNLPKLGDNVWIIVDCSGSMGGTPIRTASLFASALYMAQKNAENVAVTMFSDNAFNVHQHISRKSSVLANTNKLMNKVTGGGTNLQAALNMRPALGFEPDVVIVLSDMQVNHLTRDNYSYYGRKTVANVTEFGKDVIKVAINLNAYDSTPLAQEDGWYQLSGFSERLFDFIPAMKNKQTVTKVLSQPYFGVTGAKTLFTEK